MPTMMIKLICHLCQCYHGNITIKIIQVKTNNLNMQLTNSVQMQKNALIQKTRKMYRYFVPLFPSFLQEKETKRKIKRKGKLLIIAKHSFSKHFYDVLKTNFRATLSVTPSFMLPLYSLWISSLVLSRSLPQLSTPLYYFTHSSPLPLPFINEVLIPASKHGKYSRVLASEAG